MKLWIVVYTHRHGIDVWPVFSEERPSEADVIAGLDNWEPEREEYLDIFGPFKATP